jgi:hypothetical protein
MHLGSSMLTEWVAGEVTTGNPLNLGLKTELEMRLISRTIKDFCKQQEARER